MRFDIEVDYEDQSLGLKTGTRRIDGESLDDAAGILERLSTSTRDGVRERFASFLADLDVGGVFGGPVKPESGSWYRVRRVN